LFYNYYLFIFFNKNGIFCIQIEREERWPPKFVRHGHVYIYLGNVFAECVHFLFSRVMEYCREFFLLQFKPKFVCLRSMLAAKMFVIQTRNYILKWLNYSVTLSVLFSILPKWHVIKKQTYLQVRWVRDWTQLGWLEVSRTHLDSLGEFGKVPVTFGASNPGLTFLQVYLLSSFVLNFTLKKPLENKIIYLLYIFYKLIVLYLIKSAQVSSIFCRFVQKINKNNYRVAMTNMTWATRACVQCWRNYEYFMLKQCLENIGEGLLHACISSNELNSIVNTIYKILP
jgi:hypothetical protein